jgi:hypothetical protein
MTINIIEVSNSSYNGTSSLLSIIVLISFIYFTIIVSESLYNKLNPNAKYKDPNIMNAIIQNTMESIQYVIGIIVKDNLDKKSAEYGDKIDNFYDTIKKISLYESNMSELLDAISVKIYNNYNNQLDRFYKILDKISNVVKKMSSYIGGLNTKYNVLYTNYQKSLSNYVDNLFKTMENITTQINKITVIPALFNMIEPLKKMYNAIYNTLNNNSTFIDKFYSDGYTAEKLKNANKYNAVSNTNTNTGFNASRSILTMSGYK